MPKRIQWVTNTGKRITRSQAVAGVVVVSLGILFEWLGLFFQS